MKILILSPFKTGTTSLSATFSNNNIEVVKLHDIDHTFHTDYSHVFLVTRNQNDLYLSAFFQDINNPEFEYHYGTQEEVLEAKIEDIISHYESFDFSKYPHLNIEYYLDLLQKYFGVNISNLDDDETVRVTYGENGKCYILVRLENLTESFDDICYFAGLPKLQLEIHNSATFKWYNEIYNLVKANLNHLS